MYPDFSLDPISIGDAGGGPVVVQWVAHGTNNGAFPDGSPATGQKVTFPGVSLVQVEGEKIRSHQAYFDRLGEHKQLGFRVSRVFARQMGGRLSDKRINSAVSK